MTQHIELNQIFCTWATLASHYIGDCFDQAKPSISDDQGTEVDRLIKFVNTQLFIDCHLTSESVLLLIKSGKEWDADLLSRSVVEGTFKYVYMIVGSSEEIHTKVIEYWEELPLFSLIKHSERANRMLSDIDDSDSQTWRPIRELIVDNDAIASIRRKYTRTQRRELEERWSFSGISKYFTQSGNDRLRLLAHLAHNYGMSSHLLHKDADGIGMVWDRAMRSEKRNRVARLSHAARVVSDVCSFTKLRLFHLLSWYKEDTSCIRKIDSSYDFLFQELKNANADFNQIEYEDGIR